MKLSFPTGRHMVCARWQRGGMLHQEIKAWAGHNTDSEVARHTAAASQALLSDAPADKLMANLCETLAKRDANTLKKEA